MHIRTQTQFDPEFPPLPRQVEAEVQTRLKGRDVEAAATAAGSGVAAIRSKQGGGSGGGGGGGALGPGLIVHLKELSELVQMGILTQTEFVAAKSLLFKDAGMDITKPSPNVVALQQQQPMSFAAGSSPLPQPQQQQSDAADMAVKAGAAAGKLAVAGGKLAFKGAVLGMKGAKAMYDKKNSKSSGQ